MKLNYRDKIVLTVLIVVFVWVAGVMFFIKPAIEDVQSAQNQLENAKVTLADLEAKIAADGDLDQKIKDAYVEADKLSQTFYTYQEAQDATQLMEDLLDTDELTNNNMVISDYSDSVLSPYYFVKPTPIAGIDQQVLDFAAENEATDEPEEVEEVEEDPDAPQVGTVSIGTYSISFSFNGSLEKINDFCEKLKTSNTEKTIIIDNISFPHSNSEELSSDDELDTSISMRMFCLRRLPEPKV